MSFQIRGSKASVDPKSGVTLFNWLLLVIFQHEIGLKMLWLIYTEIIVQLSNAFCFKSCTKKMDLQFSDVFIFTVLEIK